MVKCACGNKDCDTVLEIEDTSCSTVFMRMEETKESARYCTIYLNANGIVELIRELRKALLELGNVTDGG